MNYGVKLVNDLVKIIKENRETILIGEIAGMLHDIGKCHPDFIKKHSIENGKNLLHHARGIDGILGDELKKLIEKDDFKIEIKNYKTNIYSIIKEHHDNHDKKNNDYLINIFQSCDRLDSADDKGIVRKKQHVDDTIICSPFGYKKHTINLDCIKSKLDGLKSELKEIFEEYNSNDLKDFRSKLIKALKETFPYALGETRIPANDVTLWDHSYSTASLFKTILCNLVVGEEPDSEQLKWRIIGFCWDGAGFINKGRKIADIQNRGRIIEKIKCELKQKFEYEIPVGNAIYEDINGIYFTFPALSNEKLRALTKNCIEISQEIIKNKSSGEIWPFFTLSNESRTLTVIAEELRFASQKRKTPKISPILFIGSDSKDNNKRDIETAEIKEQVDLQRMLKDEIQKIKEKDRSVRFVDICPVCQSRIKKEKKELCELCYSRMEGRLEDWCSSENREDTIWLDEVADKNNRIALITLSFNLGKWLDGTMIGTIFSQTFEDWMNDAIKIKKLKNILKDKKIKQTQDPCENALEIAKWIASNPNATEAETLLKCFKNNGKIENIPKEELVKNPEKILNYFFAQNPSPARLYRIWNETQEFFDEVLEEIKKEIYAVKWQRIKFQTQNDGIGKKENKEEGTYIIKIKDLEPEKLCVLYDGGNEFISIESLNKFKSKGKNYPGSIYAVKDNLQKNGIYYIAKEDEPETNFLEGREPLRVKNINMDENIEDYFPLIEITKSPELLQIVVPAMDSIKILKLINNLYSEKFKKVMGKLPLNIGLFIAKRKFPLYVLLDTSKRFIDGCKSEETEKMGCEWIFIYDKKKEAIHSGEQDREGNYEYFRYYPAKKIGTYEKYNLDNIKQISAGEEYEMYPGYFDFELMLGTMDRVKINYIKESKNSEKIKRVADDYKLLSSRPLYFYQISEIIELWSCLADKVSISKINNLEGIITSKLKEWDSVKDVNKKDILNNFMEATLKNTFGSNWNSLKEETQYTIVNSALNGLLLDTIIFFRHTLKIKEVI